MFVSASGQKVSAHAHTHTHTHTHTCTYTHTRTHTHTHMHTHTHTRMHTHTQEFASGGSLVKFIYQHGLHRLPEAEAKRIFVSMTSALDYCHRRCVSVCVWVCVSVCVCECVRVGACVWLCVSVCICVHVICKYMCASQTRFSLPVCAHVCVCVCVCVWSQRMFATAVYCATEGYVSECGYAHACVHVDTHTCLQIRVCLRECTRRINACAYARVCVCSWVSAHVT